MIDICLFGPARVYDRERETVLTDFTGVKPRQLLYLLALNGQYPIRKDRLAELLWNDDPPASWLSTLEGYVSLLRRGLQSGVSARNSVVVTSSCGYALDAGQASVDVDRLDALIARADSALPDHALSLLTQALSLAAGHLLDGERNFPWVVEARSRYERQVRRAAVTAGRLALGKGDLDAAAKYAQWACDLDQFGEDAWQILIEAHWRSDRRVDALRSFGAVRNLLDRELGIHPSRALQQLHTAVLRDEPFARSA